jgi:hypothetical protein
MWLGHRVDLYAVVDTSGWPVISQEPPVLADPQGRGDLARGATRGDQAQGSASELGRTKLRLGSFSKLRVHRGEDEERSRRLGANHDGPA